MSSNDDSGCGKIALVLGLIGSLIAIFVFLTGKENLPQIIDNPSGEIQSAPSLSPMNMPLPTPSDTQLPSPTPMVDTSPNSILEVGQTWVQGNVTLTLTSATLYGGGITVEFTLANHNPYQITAQINKTTFRLITNAGVALDYDSYQTGTDSLDPEQEITYIQSNSPFNGSLGDPSITWVIAIANISRIANAQWHIPIYH